MRDSTKVGALVLVALLGIAGLAGAGPLVSPDLPGLAPPMVSYQGQVTVDNLPYDGTGFFKFAVVDPAGTATYWSNDGTSAAGGEPTNATPLPVARGLFHVLLGDTSLTNMTQPLDASAFAGPERTLRVWFSTDNIHFHLLSPDRRIAAVPYALQAQEAANAGMLEGMPATAFASTEHTHAPADMIPQGAGSGLNADMLDGREAAAFADAVHSHDGLLPSGAMVLGRTDHETALVDAGFSYAGRRLGDTWSTRAAMPTGRYLLAAVAVDGVIYAVGGYSASTPYETRNQANDPVSNSWSTRAPLPAGRYGLAATTVDGVVYAIGGYESPGSFSDRNEAYDPATDSWSSMAPLPTARTYLAAVAVDGLIYAIGGYSAASSYETRNEVYDPATDSWSTRAAMPAGRRLFALAAVDGLIYAIGGQSATAGFEAKTEVYDPVANAWSTVAPMPTARQLLAAAAMDGLIFALGGYQTPGSFSDSNEAYDPATDSWRAMAAMPTRRSHLTAAAVDGAIYAIGGHRSDYPYMQTVEVYTPALYVYRRD